MRDVGVRCRREQAYLGKTIEDAKMLPGREEEEKVRQLLRVVVMGLVNHEVVEAAEEPKHQRTLLLTSIPSINGIVEDIGIGHQHVGTLLARAALGCICQDSRGLQQLDESGYATLHI